MGSGDKGKFVKKPGNANQNRMGAWVVGCFLLCEALFCSTLQRCVYA